MAYRLSATPLRNRPLMLANTMQMGFGLAPVNIVKLPTMIPVPLPNLAFTNMTVPATFRHLIQFCPMLTMGGNTFISMGDQAGVLGGIVSQRFMANSRAVTGAFTFLVGCMPVTRLGTVNVQNMMNAPGVQVAPSQFKVVVLAP